MYSNGHLMMNEAHKQLALKFLRSVEVTLNNRATARLNYVNPSISHRLGGGGGSLTTATEQELPSAIEPGVYCMLLRQAPVVAYEAYRSFSQKIDFG